MRRRWFIAYVAAGLIIAAVAVANAQSSPTDRQLLVSFHDQLHAAGIPTSPTTTASTTTTAPTTTSTAPSTTTSTTLPPTTTQATTTTTQATTTTQGVAAVSVVVFNGSRARVTVTPNNAVVTIRNPAGTIVSTGRSGDVPAQYCCPPGTYTWTAVPDAGFVASPTSGSFVVAATTTTTGATTTTQPTTTTTQAGERSYVNPTNTGNKVPESQLTVINGDLSINTDQSISNLLILGKLRIYGGAEVTAENVTVRADDDSFAAGIRVEGTGTRLTISHFTVEHTASGWSQRGVGVSGGGWCRCSFGDVSGTEDGLNTSTPHSAGQIVFDSMYVHDLKPSPPGGIDPSPGHFDGIQVMAGNVLVDRSVFYQIRPSTAAIFPKSDFGDVTLVVRDTFASGGGYTIYRGDDGPGGVTVTTFDNVEANPYPISNCGSCGGPGSRWGAVRGVTGGAISTYVNGGIEVVTWDYGTAGFHPGPQS